jgi:hypothetical protein
MNAERIEQARRFGGELCDIDGCTEYGTLEHVTAHLAIADKWPPCECAMRNDPRGHACVDIVPIQTEGVPNR